MMTKKQQPKPLENPETHLTVNNSPRMPCCATHTKTRITIKYDVGFGNTLYIRGHGANLNWERGIPMKNVKSDEWIWETDSSFPHGEFKVLINDKIYEVGTNHPIHHGKSVLHHPKFG